MRKMKAIENGSLPDINPNLGELFRGSFCDGVRWGGGGGGCWHKITLSKTC